jgi:predicted Zn-dependent peptidase
MGNVEKLYALSIINNVFGGSVSSRLFQKIREERGLVYSIYSSQSAYRECGEFGIFASMSNENLEEVYELIIEEIKEIRKNYLTEKEVKNSKEQLKGSFILGLESTSSRMLSVGKAMLLSKKVRTTDEILNLINNVDMKTIKEVIDEVFNLDNIGVCIVGRDVENIKMGV